MLIWYPINKNKTMIQDKNYNKHWIADEGKTFIRVADNEDMGNEIYLGVEDVIENYTEVEK